MAVKIYKDTGANSIFIEDANGAQFLNSLQASNNNGNNVTISDLARNIEIVSNVPHTDFIDENDNSYTGTPTEVINEFNALFRSSGTPTGDTPIITSPLTINSVVGAVINYELIATYGVGYEWDLSNVPGIVTVEGNVRKIIGGSSLSAGSYNIPVKAINYNGEDNQTIVLTVANPPFSNTKSIRFNNNDWLSGSATLLQSTLGRGANGSGAADAWTIAFYFKAGTSSNQSQTILYYGDNDVNNNNHFYIRYNGQNGNKRIIFRYGSNNNHIQLETPANSITQSTWQHVLISYDGGTTGASSADINDYYSRFSIFIDGVQQTTNNSNSNFGITTDLVGSLFRVARYSNGNYLRNNCNIDELAIWDSDQSGNIAAIYNSGNPFDLSTLTNQPLHWWRMGDGDTFPLLVDTGTVGNCDLTMNNMTSADIVNDVPL